MNTRNLFPLLLAAAALVSARAARAEYRHLGSVHNGVGRHSESKFEMNGHAWRHVSAGAQPGGIQSGTAGGVDHRAGFLQAVEVRRRDLDTDGDGVPDELDADNDGDTLADRDELDGSAFAGHAVTDPNGPDTDGDDMTDGEEAAGMYDPLDPDHRLEIVSFRLEAGHQRLEWIGKGGGAINTIRYTADPSVAPFTSVLFSGPYMGGVAPWYKTTNTYTWLDDGPILMFQIRTER